MKQEVSYLLQYYRPSIYGIATVEEAKQMTTDELAVANALADEIESRQDVRMNNTIVKAFDPGDN